jgi:hypothetical protein
LRSFSGDSKGSSLALVLYFLVLYSLCFVMFSHYVSRAHFPTLSGRSCPRARHEMLYGLRRKKEQSLSARCTEPARCTVSCKLSGVTRTLHVLAMQERKWPRFAMCGCRFFLLLLLHGEIGVYVLKGHVLMCC